MNRKMRTSFIIGLITVAATLFVSCGDILVTSEVLVYTNVKGNTVNVMASADSSDYWKGSGTETLEGAVLKFYPINTNGTYSSIPSNTVTVRSDGSYNEGAIGMRKYKIQGEKAGWVFVPSFVNISGEDMTLPPISAYQDTEKDRIVILLSWEDTDLDLDAITTYYDGYSRDYVGYLDSSADVVTPFAKQGMRNQSVTNNVPISRPRDIKSDTKTTVPRVETMVIKWNDDAPYLGNTGLTEGVRNNQLRYYVHCYSGNRSLTGSSNEAFSEAQIDIMFTDWEGNHIYKGGYKVPWHTSEDTLNMINISVDPEDGFVIYTGNGSVYEYVDDFYKAQNYIRSASSPYVSVEEVR